MKRKMPKHRYTLEELVERNGEKTGRPGIITFTVVAEATLSLPKDKRPSMTSLARLFGCNVRTFQSWLERYEEERE